MDNHYLKQAIISRQHELVQVTVAGASVIWPVGVVDQLPDCKRELQISVASSTALQHLQDLLSCNLAPKELARTRCAVCHGYFSSRRALFKHVRESQHEPQLASAKSFWERLPRTEIDQLVSLAANLGIVHLLLENGPQDSILDALSRVQYWPWRVPVLPDAEDELAAWLQVVAGKTHESFLTIKISSFPILALHFQSHEYRETSMDIAWEMLKPWGFEGRGDFHWRLQCLLHRLTHDSKDVGVDLFHFLIHFYDYCLNRARRDTNASTQPRWQCATPLHCLWCQTKSDKVQGIARETCRNVSHLLGDASVLSQVCRMATKDLNGGPMRIRDVLKLVELPDANLSKISTSLVDAFQGKWLTVLHGRARKEIISLIVALSVPRSQLVPIVLAIVQEIPTEQALVILSPCVSDHEDASKLKSILLQEPSFIPKWQIAISSARSVAVLNLVDLVANSAEIREALGSSLVEHLLRVTLNEDICPDTLARLRELVDVLAEIPASLLPGLVKCMQRLGDQGVKIRAVVMHLAGFIDPLARRGQPIRKALTDASCLCPLGEALFLKGIYHEDGTAILELFRELMGPGHQIDQQIAEHEGFPLLALLELPAASVHCHFTEVVELMRHLQGQGAIILSRLSQVASSFGTTSSQAARLMRVVVEKFELCSPGELQHHFPTMLLCLARRHCPVVAMAQELRDWLIFLENCQLAPRQHLLEADGFTHLAAAINQVRMARQPQNLWAVIELTSFALGSQTDPDYILRRHAFEAWGPLEQQMDITSDNVPGLALVVDPGNILDSTMTQILNALPASLRPNKFQVKYQGQLGIDAGGLRRDFVAKAGQGLSDVRLGLLLSAEGGHIQLSPIPGFLSCGVHEGIVSGHKEQWCRLLGRYLGISVTHNIPLGFLLVPSFCKLLVKEQPCFEDLQHVLGTQYYRSLCECRKQSTEPEPQETPAAVPLKRLTTDEANAALYGQDFEVTSRAAMIFHALENHLTRGNLADEGFDVASLLLQHASNSPQRKAAEQATASYLCSLCAHPCGMKAEDVCEMFASHDALPYAAVQKLQEVLPADSLMKLLSLAKSLPSSSIEDLVCNILRKVYEVTETAFKEHASAGPAPLPPGLGHDTSAVEAQDVGSGESLCRANLESFIVGVTEKVLEKNLHPYASIVRDEYRIVHGPGNQRTWQELQRAVAGEEVAVESWSGATVYRGYVPADVQVQWWWQLMEESDSTRRRRLFKWCTGFACMPVGGIQFVLQRSGATGDLPRASTCFSTLKLPPYESKDRMREKLDWALEESGFENA